MRHEAAQRGEEVDDDRQPVITQPWVRRGQSTITLTQVIFGANIAVFLAMLFATGSPSAYLNPEQGFPNQILIPYGANVGPYTLSGDWWRLFTYMFLHGGAVHIFVNMWCLWYLGEQCESLYGRWTYAAIYLITGVSGGLASIAWNPRVLSVGASGAIFGLAGALIASFYLGEFSLPRESIRGRLLVLLLFAVFNLGFGGEGVDNACHIGGLVSGLILGTLIARLAPQSDAPMGRATVLGIVVLAVLAAGFGVRQWRGGPMRMARAFQETSGDQVAHWQAIIKQSPNLVPAHFALAQAYLASGRYPEAEAELKRVIELQPDNIAARLNLGYLYLREQRLDDAKSAFTQILAQDANRPEGHYGLGLVLANQQNDTAAIEEFKKATSGSSRLSGVYYEMGNSYAKLQRYDDAITAYLKEKEITGEDPDLESALADAYQAKGMTREAEEARELAQQLRGQAR
jgi:rhomboid protease GluP